MTRIVLFSLLIICITCTQAFAQFWEEIDKENPSAEYTTDDYFGASIAVDGNYAVVGASESDIGAKNSGVAYVYKLENGDWQKIASLTPSDPSEEKGFGNAVAIHKNCIVIGASDDSEGELYGGAAYVFEKTTAEWNDMTETAKLLSSDIKRNSSFGGSVSIYDKTIAVGDQYANTSIEFAGAVYIYERPVGGWINTTENAKIIANDPTTLNGVNNAFGSSIALNENYLFVGAPYHDVNHYDDGAIYVYKRPTGGWKSTSTQVTKLFAQEGTDNHELGWSIDIQGDFVAGSARGGYDPSGLGGIAYLFKIGEQGWKDGYQVARLTAKQSDTWAGLSTSVALEDDYIALGSRNSNGKGTTYLFNRPATGWKNATEDLAIIPEDLDNKSYFGHTVVAIGETLLIGAPKDNRVGLSSGSVFTLLQENGNWETTSLQRWETPLFLNSSNYLLGYATSISGDFAVVGAPNDRTTGAAYVYEYKQQKWQKVAKLKPSDGKDGDYFGSAVSMYGDYIIVGAKRSDNEKGSSVGTAYIFTKSAGGWQDSYEQARLSASDGKHNDQFGISVDINQNYAVVGAYQFGSSDEVGAVYIFEMNGNEWKSMHETAKLLPSDPSLSFAFGYDVSCYENQVLVGAPNSGRNYLFERKENGWNPKAIATLNVPVFKIGKVDGYDIKLSEDIIAIGIPNNYDKGTQAGLVYIYEKHPEGWSKTTTPIKLYSPQPMEREFFGYDVGIDEDLLVVGAPGNAHAGDNTGKVYVYARNLSEWELISEIVAKDNNPEDRFGIAADITDGHIISGAVYNKNESGFNAGAAYFYEITVPQVQKVTSTNANGFYGIGQEIYLDVVFNKVINTGGETMLQLNTGNKIDSATYFKGNGTEKLTFVYTVKEGDYTDDLDYYDINALRGKISGNTGKPAFTILPYPGRSNSLSGLKNIKIDGIRPLITDSLSVSTNTQKDTVTIFYQANEPLLNIDKADFVANNGNILSFQQLSNQSFKVVIAGIQEGRVSVTIPENTMNDRAGNGNLPIQTSFIFDKTAPTLKINTEQGLPIDSCLFTVNFLFNEEVVNFTLKDINITNGEAINFRNINDTLFLVDIIPLNSGQISVTIAEGQVWDKAGNILPAITTTFLYAPSQPSMVPHSKILAGDGKVADYFGASVAIYGNYAIIGANGAKNSLSYDKGGVAYIYQRKNNKWVLQQKLEEPEIGLYDEYGFAVDIDGEYAIVGAYDAGSSGYTYIYKNLGTHWERIIRFKGEGRLSYFGYAVALHQGMAVVGAPGHSGDNDAVYILENLAYDKGGDEWIITKILPKYNHFRARFGRTVALYNKTVVVGAWTNSADEYYNKSSVHVYEKAGNQWVEIQELFPTDEPDVKKQFGYAVDIYKDMIVVGTPGDKINEQQRGAAYIFAKSNGKWKQEAKLISTAYENSNYFGSSVAAGEGQIILHGTHNHTGRVHLYRKEEDSWQEIGFITSDLPYNGGYGTDEYGNSIDIFAKFAIIGNTGDASRGTVTGSAHIIDLSFLPLHPPADLSASLTEQLSIKLTWTDLAEGEKGYQIEKSTKPDFSVKTTYTLSPNATIYTDHAIISDSTYYYRVFAYEDFTRSVYSNIIISVTQPVVPSNVSARLTEGGNAEISWKDVSSNEAGFYIYRFIHPNDLMPSGQFQVAQNTSVFTDTTLFNTNADTLYYQVIAYNQLGSSLPSEIAPLLIYVPGPDQIAGKILSKTAVQIKWRDNADNESGFLVERSANESFSSIATFYLKSDHTSFIDNSIEDTVKTYFYRVSAFNALSTSLPTQTLSITFQLQGPTNFIVQQSAGGGVQLNWSDQSDNEEGFIIERSTYPDFTEMDSIVVPANTTSYTDTGILEGVTYYYRIKAYNAAAVSNEQKSDILVITGTEKFSTDISISVGPNPFEDVTQWTIKGSYSGKIYFRLYDSYGQELLSKILFKKNESLFGELSLENFPNGLYYLHIYYKDNFKTLKLIKMK